MAIVVHVTYVTIYLPVADSVEIQKPTMELKQPAAGVLVIARESPRQLVFHFRKRLFL